MAKPTPNMLGTGMAAKAGKKLKKRKSRMDEMIERASGPKPRKTR